MPSGSTMTRPFRVGTLDEFTNRASEVARGLGSARSVTYHRNALRGEGLLLQADPPRVADPLLAAWIREGRI